MTVPPIVLRAEAGGDVGIGHLARCIALAEAQRGQGGEAWFAVGSDAARLLRVLRKRDFAYSHIRSAAGTSGDADELDSLARRIGATACVIDGYGFSSQYMRSLGDTPMRVVALDDLGRHLPADVIVNPTYRARPLQCAGLELTGPRYAPLRPEILQRPRGRGCAESEPARVLISFGGCDRTLAAARVLGLLPRRRSVVATVVIGPGYRDQSELEIAARRAAFAGHVVELIREPADMGLLQSMSDAAVCAAGSILWELAYFSCPTLAFSVADNQRSCAAALAADGLVLSGEPLSDLDDTQVFDRIGLLLGDATSRKRLSDRFADLVDGDGSRRVLQAIHGLEEPS